MARTEFHLKLAEQIEAIKSVAQANQKVAEVLGERAHLAKFVIDLVRGISCFKYNSRYKNCDEIEFGDLGPSAQLAYTALGFQTDQGNNETDLITLCKLIEAKGDSCPDLSLKATSKAEPITSPTTTPPGKGSEKKV